MGLENGEYLLNVSVVAITFTAVSAIIMLVRQSMGGKISPFDIYLITAYTSFGFAQAICALLPALFALFHLPATVLWAISGILAAAILGSVSYVVIRQRLKVSPVPFSPGVRIALSLHGVAVVIFLVNAAVVPWQGLHLYAFALTLSLAAVMWAFARRIASLFGERVGEDWDPKRG
jgi:hypothetical protein